MEPFTVPSASPGELSRRSHSVAMRRVRPAESVPVTLCNKRPASFFFRQRRYIVEQAYGPWLMSGDWWTPTVWSHWQWHLVARSQDGSLLSCCLTHDLIQACWQMVALYD